jgi:hypothetical protein
MGRADGGDEALHLVAGQHVGQAADGPDAELREEGPVARAGAAIEETDAVEGEPKRSGGELLLVLQEEKVLAELGLGEPVRRVWRWSAS